MVQEPFPPGARVMTLDGEALGTVRHAYPNYLMVALANSDDDVEVPINAVGRYEGGTIYLSVNRGALTVSRDAKSYERLHPDSGTS